MTYRVVATTRFAVELRNAPGELRGYVSAVVAVLRVDPTIASLAFSVVRHAEDERTVIFAGGRGFLTYWLPPGHDIVVLLRLIWAA